MLNAEKVSQSLRKGAKAELHFGLSNRSHGDALCSLSFPLTGVPETRRFSVDWGGRKGWGVSEATDAMCGHCAYGRDARAFANGVLVLDN